jgi:hypothetical protein
MRLPRLSRESRLLLLTVGVCAVALIVLARLRFPEPPPPVETAAPPLERLAARASYDALAADIQRVEQAIAPNLVVLRVAQQLPAMPHVMADVLERPDLPSGTRHVAALRISDDIALAQIDPGAHIAGIVGGQAPPGTEASVLAVDRVRRIARIRVPTSPARPLQQLALSALPAPVYVVAVEGTQAGVTMRPVFLGRGDRFASTRWPRPLLALGGLGVAPGALLFTLAGEFLGAVVVEDGGHAVAGARDVLDTAERLGSGSAAGPPEIGAAVQRLTPALSQALAAGRGVLVSDVDPGGPAAAAGLEAADVITALDGSSTDSPDEFLLRLAARRPGDVVSLAFVRGGEARSASLTLGLATSETRANGTLALAVEPGMGTRIGSGRELAIPGLIPGDIVTRAGDARAPNPAQLRRVLGRATSTGYAVLLVRRAGRQHALAVSVGKQHDASAR